MHEDTDLYIFSNQEHLDTLCNKHSTNKTGFSGFTLSVQLWKKKTTLYWEYAAIKCFDVPHKSTFGTIFPL